MSFIGPQLPANDYERYNPSRTYNENLSVYEQQVANLRDNEAKLETLTIPEQGQTPEGTKVLKKFSKIRSLLDPTTMEKRICLPVGPDNEQNFRTLASTAYLNLTTATSGNGLILTYPGLPFFKFGEHWVDDGAGNLVFKEYIMNAVNPSKQHTYGRVIRSIAEFKSGYQAVTSGGSISGGVQGQWMGTVVEGGIAQLYNDGVSSAQVFSLANLSQLTSSDNHKLLGTSSADGIAYNQPPLNTPFLRLSDAVPGADEPGSNRNVDWSLQDVEYMNQDFSKSPTWAGGVINFTSTVLEKEFAVASIGIDVPYHGEILSNLALSMGRISAAGGINSGIFYQLWADFYGLDRLTPDKSYEIVKGTIDINTILNTDYRFEGAGFKVVPDLDDDELHVTWTAVKMRLRIYIIEAPTTPFSITIAAQASTKVTQPLYCGRGMVQRPTLFVYSNLGAEAPIVCTIKNKYELTPDTAFSRIVDSEQREVSFRTYKILMKISHRMPSYGLSWFYTPGSTQASTNRTHYVRNLMQLIAMTLATTYRHLADEIPLDYSHHFASKLGFLKKIGKAALTVAKPVYNHGGRQLIKNMVPAEYRPAADVILPKHFASGSSFASGISFATRMPSAYFQQPGPKVELHNSFTILPVEREDDTSQFVWLKHIEPNLINSTGCFVPSVNREGRHLLGDLWYLTEVSPKLLDWFDKNVADKGSYKNWSQINSNQVIYGHTGEKFFNPQIQKSLILLHVKSSDPLTFDSCTIGDGDSLGLAVQAFSRIKGPLDVAFSGATRGNDVMTIDPIVAYCKLKACAYHGVPLVCNAELPGVIKINKVSDLNVLKSFNKSHRFSGNEPQMPGLAESQTQQKPQRKNSKRLKIEAKLQPKTQPKIAPQTTLAPKKQEREPKEIPKDWTGDQHGKFVYRKINNQLFPTGRFQALDRERFSKFTKQFPKYLEVVVDLLEKELIKKLTEPQRSSNYRGIVAASARALFTALVDAGIVFHHGIGYSNSKYLYPNDVYELLLAKCRELITAP